MKEILLTEIMNGAWRDRALTTCEDRGIPSIVDGLKPVQRFLICQGYRTAKTEFDKVSALGGAIAALGYEHGEASACGALTSMAASFSNNLPLFEGDGQFGNVLDPSPAQPRYIFARLAPYIDFIFKDNDLAPENPDPEIVTPLYYLPIIPLCLINGVSGLATGFSVNIPPHCPISIIDNLIRLTEGKSPKKIQPKYYSFSGDVRREVDRYVLTGTFERKSPIKIIVTDLPPLFNTNDSYEKFLKKLVNRETIASYENLSGGDKFHFEITLRKGMRWTDEEVIKNLKLSSNHIWNFSVVMPNRRIKVWDKETGLEDILTWFYEFRIEFIEKRIEKMRNELIILERFYGGFVRFVEDVTAKRFSMNELSDSAFKKMLLENYSIPNEFVEKVMNAPIRTFTTDKLKNLSEKLDSVKSDLSYYGSTTKEVEFRKDLENLRSKIKSLG